MIKYLNNLGRTNCKIWKQTLFNTQKSILSFTACGNYDMPNQRLNQMRCHWVRNSSHPVWIIDTMPNLKMDKKKQGGEFT